MSQRKNENDLFRVYFEARSDRDNTSGFEDRAVRREVIIWINAACFAIVISSKLMVK